MKSHTLKTARPRRPVTLPDLIAREHGRIVKLTTQLESIRRRLARARTRYSALNRLELDMTRRQIMTPALPAAARPEHGDAFEFEPSPAPAAGGKHKPAAKPARARKAR